MSSKKPKGNVNFHQDWEVKYGVQICTRDPMSKEVSSVVCLICTNFGRKDIDEGNRKRKRKQTANDKYFTSPWRTDSFVSHLRTQQHSSIWEEYKNLSSAEKKTYLATFESPEVVTLRSFKQPEASTTAKIIAKQKCSFVIDADIVTKVIVDLLLTPPPPRTQGGSDEDLLEAASATTALFSSEEEYEVDGFGDEGSTSTEVVIEERRRILKVFVHSAEEDVYSLCPESNATS